MNALNYGMSNCINMQCVPAGQIVVMYSIQFNVAISLYILLITIVMDTFQNLKRNIQCCSLLWKLVSEIQSWKFQSSYILLTIMIQTSLVGWRQCIMIVRKSTVLAPVILEERQRYLSCYDCNNNTGWCLWKWRCL